MITLQEDTAFKFVEVMFIKRKMTLLESKDKVSGKRTLLLCALQPADNGGSDLIPVGRMFLAEETVDMASSYEMPEGATQHVSTEEDFHKLLRR